MAFAAEPYTGDVLVVLSLRGGFDGLNTIVPTADPRYLEVRPRIGIPQNALLPLDDMFGLHPAMAAAHAVLGVGQFGAVQAVGMTQPDAVALRGDGGDGARSARLVGALGVARPHARAARRRHRVSRQSRWAAAWPPSAFRGPASELAMWSVNDFELSGAWDGTERQRWTTALTVAA